MTHARSHVAVLGASGFIGQYVTRALRRDHVVLEIGRDQEARAVDASVCIHLAEPNAHEDPSLLEANVQRAVAIRAGAFTRIVYASSAGVYGDLSSAPRKETDAPQPRNLYAKAKLAVEEVFAGDPRCAVVRLANVYGPGMSERSVLADLLRQVPREPSDPIQLRDLSPVRDYVHVLDVARAFVRLANATVSGVINIGSGIGTSVADLARLARRIAGQPARDIVQTGHTVSPSHLVLAITRATEELGWSPGIDLERGLTALIRGEQP